MKVLMCGNHLINKGGMTSVICQVLEYDWNSENIQLEFIPTYMPGGKVKTILYFLFAYIKIFFVFLNNKPDVFYTHMSSKGSFTRTKLLHNLCKLFNVRDVIHLHGSEFEKWYKSVSANKQRSIKNLIEGSNAFIVLGKNWETYIHKVAPNANVFQVHNCVRIPKEITSFNEEKLRILYLGVLIKRKGVIDLLKSIKLLKDNNKIKNLEFYIGGTGNEGKKLMEFVEENNLDEYVKFLGWVEGNKKDELIKNSNVFVLPSYNEGLPVSILEAMSYGLPIISTDVGDIADAVYDGRNGYLIEPGNFELLAEKIASISEHQVWSCFSARSREIAEKQFDIGLFYDNLIKVWSSVCQ